MWHANNETWKKTNNGRIRIDRSRMNQNAWSKGNIQLLGNIGSGHHQISGDERKKKTKKRISDEREN